MTLTRRSTLTIAGGAVAVGVLGYLGWRQFTPAPAPLFPTQPTAPTAIFPAGDQRMAERSLGDPAAKVTVLEFFSLTCTHCAAFARETMPDVEKQLIGPGKVRFVFHDFPLDQVALTAAMVARYLPPAQYYPFVSALFANQDRWAFARGINTTDEIWKLAALAGMSRATFDQAIADSNLRSWILQQQQADQDRWKIDSTPSFVINGQTTAGEMSFDAFRKLLPDV
ncbi:MAG TPA: thioredoxin domain-containing protein [Acetobacteraceae bacterium]|jgi:protein-disulfide isomerase